MKIYSKLQPREVSEAVLKGDNAMQSYYNMPEVVDITIVNGSFKTEDFGKIEEERFLYIIDRFKDVSKRNKRCCV